MAAIVYEGVGGGGNLFEGIKFFILQRVPSRSTWKELIEVHAQIFEAFNTLTLLDEWRRSSQNRQLGGLHNSRSCAER